MIAIGNTTYVRGELFGFGGDGSKWTKLTAEEGLGTEFSPQQLLGMLRGASQETRRIGEEDVRGVEAVRYRLEVDCDQTDLVDCDGATNPVDVWIDDDGLVRKISIEDKSVSATVEFYSFGVAVDIQPPPDDQVGDPAGLREPCGSGFGVPIRLRVALDTLRRHDFSVPGDATCSVGLAAFGNANAASDALAREGQLYCFVHESAPSGAPVSVRRRGADGADAELALHNLECTILADSPKGEEKIDRLEAAFAELERTVRP
jgi:hypothetical protein